MGGDAPAARFQPEVLLLGPVEVMVGGRPARLAPLERALVAVLTLATPDVVSIDRIVDELWSAAPPPTARTRVHMLVSAARRVLGPAVVTRRPGYVLDTSCCSVDLEAAHRSVAAARTFASAGNMVDAAAAYRAALRWWRGPALQALPPGVLGSEAVRLDDLRMSTLEERVDAELIVGRDWPRVAELTGLVARHPHRERLRVQLMRALRRAGRPAEALAVYQAAHTYLAEELGVEPSPDLRAQRAAILNGDADAGPELALPLPMPRTPAQLPTDIVDFTGRAGSVNAVSALLDPRGVGADSAAVHARRCGLLPQLTRRPREPRRSPRGSPQPVAGGASGEHGHPLRRRSDAGPAVAWRRGAGRGTHRTRD